ncbi:MAG: DUF6941 family protein [Fimbriimonadaceae bacterium]
MGNPGTATLTVVAFLTAIAAELGESFTIRCECVDPEGLEIAQSEREHVLCNASSLRHCHTSFRFNKLNLREPGVYEFRFSINGEPCAYVTDFDVENPNT